MIVLSITNADIKQTAPSTWEVRHPTNGSIFAFCDSEREANEVVKIFNVSKEALKLLGEKVA